MCKLQVDVQLLRPSVMDKQQPYWTWGDSADDIEELVDLLGDDAEQQTGTSASVEEKEKDIDDTANLPSSSKASITVFRRYTSYYNRKITVV